MANTAVRSAAVPSLAKPRLSVRSDFHQIKTALTGTTTITDAEAAVDARADVLFQLMADPARHTQLFQEIENTTYTLVEDNWPKRTWHIGYTARWHFWKMSGTFDSKLSLETDAEAGTVTYKLREPGFLREYEGTWQFLPAGRQMLNLAESTRQLQAAAHQGTAGVVARIFETAATNGQGKAAAPLMPPLAVEELAALPAVDGIMPQRSVVRVIGLRQSPKLAPPPLMRGLLRGKAENAIRDNLNALWATAQDLQQAEATVSDS